MDFKSVSFIPPPRLVCIELNPGPAPLDNDTTRARWEPVVISLPASKLSPFTQAKGLTLENIEFFWGKFVLFCTSYSVKMRGAGEIQLWFHILPQACTSYPAICKGWSALLSSCVFEIMKSIAIAKKFIFCEIWFFTKIKTWRSQQRGGPNR
jgi:hypothetical protein